MATYLLWSGGNGTDGTEAGGWANAYTSLTNALAAATAAGDIIKMHYTHAQTTSGVTYTFANSVSLISVDKDNADALTAQGTSGQIASTGASFIINVAGYNVLIHGVSFDYNNAASRNFVLANVDGSSVIYENCNLRFLSASSGTSNFRPTGSTDVQTFVHLKNTTLKFNATGNYVNVTGRMLFEGVVIEASGTAPTTLFLSNQLDPGGGSIDCVGCDFSYLGSATLLGDMTTQSLGVRLSQCKLGSGFVMLGTQTEPNKSSGEISIFDCASGDTHGLFGYANALGSVVSDTGIYFTSGAAAQSWKITTTPDCSFATPFETPWLGYYNTVTTAITPYVEILRDGSTTAYQDDEVWLDVMAKTTSGSTQSSLTTDRMTLLGTPANHAAGAGLGSWTGESGTAWSGKMVMASLTPAEAGHIQARIVVGEPSVTVYADPLIRT